MLNKTFWITVAIVALAVIAVLSILPTPSMSASHTDGDSSFVVEGEATFSNQSLLSKANAHVGSSLLDRPHYS
jgi:hypothetical protein